MERDFLSAPSFSPLPPPSIPFFTVLPRSLATSLRSYVIKRTTCVLSWAYFPPQWPTSLKNTHARGKKLHKCKCGYTENSDTRTKMHECHLCVNTHTHKCTHTPHRAASCPASLQPTGPAWAVRSHDQWPSLRDIKHSILHELIMAKNSRKSRSLCCCRRVCVWERERER